MVNLDSRIIKKEKSKYTEDEVQYALNYLNSFLEKLQKLYVIEDGKKDLLIS